MPNHNQESIQDRLARLEKKVEALEKRLDDQPKSRGSSLWTKEKEAAETRAPDQNPRLIADRWELGEQWLNRIGMGLLLIGVAFLFKYSIDQGWLIPPVRSFIGLSIGMILFYAGARMPAASKPMKQILLGGGIATFYITGFATYQFYSFLPPAVIWGFMIVTTLLALSLSLQQSEPILSVIGTLGALGTPFMLYSGSGSVIMLVLYTALVLSGATAVYLAKEWKALLWSLSLGGFAVMAVGIVNTAYDHEKVSASEHWALQAGLVICAAVSWVLPVLKEMRNRRRRFGGAGEALAESENTRSSIHLLAFLVPLLVLLLTTGVWDLNMEEAGIASIVLAGVGSLFYPPLHRIGLKKLSSTHVFLALIMFTIGITLLLEGNFLFVVLAAEAVALRFVAHQTEDRRIDISAHLLTGIVSLWLLNIWYSTGLQGYFPGIEALSQLGFIACCGILVPLWLDQAEVKQVYRILGHLLFLIWVYYLFSAFQDGQAWVTIAWGAYAVALLVLGFVTYGRGVRFAGMTTIFIVVGKLFLIDLSQLQAIWRILLFIGFGAIFLFIGYYWQSKWSGEEELGNN